MQGAAFSRAAAVFAGALSRFVVHKVSQYGGVFFKLLFGNHRLDMGFPISSDLATADSPPMDYLPLMSDVRRAYWSDAMEDHKSLGHFFRSEPRPQLFSWQTRGSLYFRAVASCSRRFVGGRWRQAALWGGSRNGGNGFFRFWMV
jgi:hypothetical protein